jgi:hypothetical protein
MSKKICKNCHEINSGGAMICSNCNNTLVDAEIKEDDPFSTGQKEVLLGTNAATRSTIYSDDSDSISIGMWIGIFILTAIPIVNIIALCYMAFGGHNETIKNYGKASLIMGMIGIVFLILIRGCSGYR